MQSTVRVVCVVLFGCGSVVVFSCIELRTVTMTQAQSSIWVCLGHVLYSLHRVQ